MERSELVTAPATVLLDSPLEDAFEAAVPGLPFLLIIVSQSAKLLIGRQSLQEALNRGIDRAAKTGAAMAGVSIYGRITALTRQAFGVAINPHLFRDAAATSIAIDDPEHVQVSAALLGHASLKTTQRHYDQSRMLAAGRRYQDQLVGLRRRLRRSLHNGTRTSAMRETPSK